MKEGTYYDQYGKVIPGIERFSPVQVMLCAGARKIILIGEILH